jgi:uncharacterized protein YcfJ
MQHKLLATAGVAALLAAGQVAASITLYNGPGFRGRAVTVDKEMRNLERVDFNDKAASVVVDKGRWEVCEHARFEGKCVVLRRGSYDSLAMIGLDDSISSVRPVGRASRAMAEPEPLPAPTYEYRVRPNERTYEVPVSNVRAVVGPPEQRCWVERQQVSEPRGEPNVGGAVLGAVIGGVLGHQVGSGRGNDVATVGGALAGGAIGANTGRGSGTYSRDVQRCTSAPPGPPQFYDVTYNFRGVEHRVQMQAPPGRTILVNGQGEPRG